MHPVERVLSSNCDRGGSGQAARGGFLEVRRGDDCLARGTARAAQVEEERTRLRRRRAGRVGMAGRCLRCATGRKRRTRFSLANGGRWSRRWRRAVRRELPVRGGGGCRLCRGGKGARW